MWKIQIIIYEILVAPGGSVSKHKCEVVDAADDVKKWLEENGERETMYCSELVHVWKDK